MRQALNDQWRAPLAAARREKMNDVVDNDIDRTIHGVETLYRSLTGGPPANGETVQSAIPPEVDPNHYVNTQLDRLIAMLDPRWLQPPQHFAPPVAIWEALDEYVITIDLPGVPRDAIQLSPMGQALQVTAKRPIPQRDGQRLRYWPRWQEANVGQIERVIPMPADASLQQIEAKLETGCLVVRVPRSTNSGAIPVR
jgi:HSP20 family protein